MSEIFPKKTDTVPKLLIRGYITALFIVVLMAFAVSTVAIVRAQKGAADAAVSKQLNEASVYANNHAACGLRALVDPTIAAQKRSLAISESGAKDKTVTASARHRSALNVKSLHKSLIGLYKVRALYGTIPPGYDCSKLPKTPPQIAT